MIGINDLKNYEFSFAKIDEVAFEDITGAKKHASEECMKEIESGKNVGAKRMLEMEEEYKANGKLFTYLSQRIFPDKDSPGFYIIEDGMLQYKSKDVWAKYNQKIVSKSKLVYKNVCEDHQGLYKAHIYPEEFIIDTKGKRINLAKHMHFRFDEKAKQDKKNGAKVLNYIREIIVSDNQEQWDCLCYIISCMLKGIPSHLVTFLQGLGGIGKSFFCEKIIGRLLGQAMGRTNETVLSGSTQFNGAYIGLRACLLEETSGSSAKSWVYEAVMRSLKEMSTAEVLNIRKLYAEEQPIPNMINFVVLSNHYRDLDVGDRRVFFPEISNKYQNNTLFFAEFDKLLTPEVMQYVFNYFYDVDTSTKLKAPETQSKVDYKETHLPSSIKFLIQECLVRNPADTKEKTINEMYKKYEDYCNEHAIKHICAKDLFSSY